MKTLCSADLICLQLRKNQPNYFDNLNAFGQGMCVCLFSISKNFQFRFHSTYLDIQVIFNRIYEWGVYITLPLLHHWKILQQTKKTMSALWFLYKLWFKLSHPSQANFLQATWQNLGKTNLSKRHWTQCCVVTEDQFYPLVCNSQFCLRSS